MQDVLEVKGELSQVIDYGIVFEDLEKKVQADLAITINGVEDKSGYKLADQRRKEWVKVRTGIDKKRKEMNAAAREHIKRVDAVAAEFTEIAGQAEDHVTRLVDQIDAEIAAAEKEKADAAYNAKNAQLLHVGIELNRVVVESLTDEQIAAMIEEKIITDRLKREEAERQAAAKAEADRRAAEERERHRIESEKLTAERAEFERQKAEQAAEFAKLKAAQEEQQRKIDEETRRIRQAEIARIEAEEIAKREAFEAERLRIVSEQAAKEAEAKLIREQAEAKAAAERAEALRPDREKLLSVAAAIHAVQIPQVSDELAETVKEINRIILRAVTDITAAVN